MITEYELNEAIKEIRKSQSFAVKDVKKIYSKLETVLYIFNQDVDKMKSVLDKYEYLMDKDLSSTDDGARFQIRYSHAKNDSEDMYILLLKLNDMLNTIESNYNVL